MAKRRQSVASTVNENTSRHNLLVRVARLYYLCNLTHQEIASQEGMSRIKVTRLLKEALDRKIVEFHIKDPLVATLELEDEMQRAFSLRRVILTPNPVQEADYYDILGRFAADCLQRELKNGMRIGIGWGRTLNGMLPYLGKGKHNGLHVVSLTGGLAANQLQPNPYDVASAMAQRIGATPHYPIVPIVVESRKVRDLLMRERKIQEIVEQWKRIDIALMSIGVIAADTGLYYSFPDPAAEAERVRELGAVGDILAAPYDLQGNFLETGFLDRMIRIDMEDLKRIPLVAGIAGGPRKVQAILGGLRTGCLNALVTDERTARQVLELSKKQ
jgi:DNA-binding transcriptional regulator LsrR (DeoR family)